MNKSKNVKSLKLNCSESNGIETKRIQQQAKDQNSIEIEYLRDSETLFAEKLESLQIDFISKHDDLKELGELGSGCGGTVYKVVHGATGTVMARKILRIESNKDVQNRIIKELKCLYECRSEYIVAFYGAYQSENNIFICMEYMDCGSLSSIRSQVEFTLDILAKTAYSIVQGLFYLYNFHRIIHRDIKPSNVLLNTHGQIKLCDFGVSSAIENSIAHTFVGTCFYMSPERIQGGDYTIKGDIWSLGISLLELTTGQPPYISQDSSILELLQKIVMEESPRLLGNQYHADLKNFISKCCEKNVDKRSTLDQLMKHPLIASADSIDLSNWSMCLEKK